MRVAVREDRERLEASGMLAADAAFSSRAVRADGPALDRLRTDFQRDRDKIIHTKSFRRLSHKTQVFLAAEGDHFRTRLTHTLEVAQIARTIARALALNEDLTEAIALGHDLGHTPFGHAGEKELAACIARVKGVDPASAEAKALYRHNEQSLRVVDVIERDGRGLGLTDEVRDGIVHHTGSVRPRTLEGRIVAISDRIAYVNHDIDDAIRSGLLTEEDLPQTTREVIGRDHSARIEALVDDLVDNAAATGDIRMTDPMWEALCELRSFMYRAVYYSDPVVHEQQKARHLIRDLFSYFLEHPEEVPTEYRAISDGDDVRAVTDFVAGMTDRYARMVYEDLFIPRPWR
ncbi:deoxyguanosinetriphosphate triphosphohydrolase [Slackia piriformis]|nr:deoxyguanosinetriphosphate triphosphohydrolase [Slackia piriformis]